MKKTIIIYLLSMYMVQGYSQAVFTVVSIDSVKGQTVFFTGKLKGTEATLSPCSMTFKGMGKKPDILGKEVIQLYSKRYRKVIYKLKNKDICR